jgi:hypothetical protein
LSESRSFVEKFPNFIKIRTKFWKQFFHLKNQIHILRLVIRSFLEQSGLFSKTFWCISISECIWVMAFISDKNSWKKLQQNCANYFSLIKFPKDKLLNSLIWSTCFAHVLIGWRTHTDAKILFSLPTASSTTASTSSTWTASPAASRLTKRLSSWVDRTLES